ncbi:MAG: serine/threonine-protein kinase [candidate division Zixibacteria bacterium]
MKAPFTSENLTFEAILGEGGTARVSRAHCQTLNRPVAVKYGLPDSENSEQFDRLVSREYELIGNQSFSGLVRLLDRPNRAPSYLLMELCHGPTLDTVEMTNCIWLALNFISAIAIDLEFLQNKGIVHGDIKPQNIFLPPDWRLMRQDELFWLKLSDFSLGREAGEPEESRAGLGTIGFMAPETIRSSVTSFKSDIFSLGVIAFQLLTGQHPFLRTDSDPVKVNGRILTADYPSIRDLNKDIPEEVAGLVDSMLAVEPDERPSSGWEICCSLEKAGTGLPFRKAIRPSDLINPAMGFDQVVQQLLGVRPGQSEHLAILTDKNKSQLRLLLTANFRRGNLTYSDRRFEFNGPVHWPARMRHHVLSEFQQLSISGKKKAIRHAISGDTEYRPATQVAWHPSLIQLLLSFLRPATVRRLSAQVASRAYESESYELATRLYLQAGNLRKASLAAETAAAEMQKENRTDGSLELINRVLAFAHSCDALFEVRHLLMLKGDTLKQVGEIDEAMISYNRLLKLYENHEPDELLAETYKDLGDLHRMRQDADAGLEALEVALGLYEQFDDTLEVSHTRNNMGNLFWLKGDLDSSLANFRTALKIQRRLNASQDIASTLNNIGILYFLNGRFKRTIRMFDLALGLQREIGDSGEIARTLNNLGHTNHVLGDQTAALGFLEESLALNRRIGSKKEILFNLENLTEVAIAAGHLRESLILIKEGIPMAEGIGDQPHLAAFHLNMCKLYRYLGQFDPAYRCLERADEIANLIDDQQLPLKVSLEKAILSFLSGDKQAAHTIATQLSVEAEKSNESHIQLSAGLLLLRIEPDNARIEQLRSMARKLHLVREEMILDLAAADGYLEKGETAKAAEIVGDISGSIRPESEDVDLPWILNVMAESEIESGNTDQAMNYLSRSVQLAGQAGLLPELITAHTLMGRVEMDHGKYESCYARFREGLSVCQEVAGNLPPNIDQSHYKSHRMIRYLVESITALKSATGKTERAEALSRP